MRRQVVIVLGVVVVCSLILYGLFTLTAPSATPPETNEGEGLPISEPISRTIPTEETFPIHTSSGDVVVKNFYKTSSPLVGYDGVKVRDTPDYYISYVAPDNLITVILYTKPILETRKKAERDLLLLLGISESDLCKINVRVGTVVSADPELAGKELGLSFCN